MNEYRLLKCNDDYVPQVKRWYWPFWCSIIHPCHTRYILCYKNIDDATLACAQHSKGFFHAHLGKM